MAFVVSSGRRRGLLCRRLHYLQGGPAHEPREHKRGEVKHGLVNNWQLADDADNWRPVHRHNLSGDEMISEIEIIHLLDGDEAEFPEAALLAASLVRRGWVSRMPAKYQALAADFIAQGIVKDETTEIRKDMRPRIRFIIEDGQPTIAESIGCPIEVTVVDKTRKTEAVYSTHEGESHPVMLFYFREEGDEDGNAHSGEI